MNIIRNRFGILPRGVAAACLAALLALALIPAATAQRGARVLQRNLPELVDDAYTIVVGRVTSVRSELHPQFRAIQNVVVTLDVSEVWKGKADKQFTIRLFVDDPIDQKTNLGYRIGQQFLLFMTQPSKYGMSSPAGLEQGRFLIQEDAQGNRSVTNGLNNMGLFRNIERTPAFKAGLNAAAQKAVEDHRSGGISLGEMKEMVRILTSNQ